MIKNQIDHVDDMAVQEKIDDIPKSSRQNANERRDKAARRFEEKKISQDPAGDQKAEKEKYPLVIGKKSPSSPGIRCMDNRCLE